MNPTEPIDYLAAIEQLRQEEQSEEHQIHAPDHIPVCSDEPVDYLAVSKAWEKEQASRHKLQMHIKKRNLSHDPERS